MRRRTVVLAILLPFGALVLLGLWLIRPSAPQAVQEVGEPPQPMDAKQSSAIAINGPSPNEEAGNGARAVPPASVSATSPPQQPPAPPAPKRVGEVKQLTQ